MPGLPIASTHLLPPRNTSKVGPAKLPYDFEMMGAYVYYVGLENPGCMCDV